MRAQVHHDTALGRQDGALPALRLKQKIKQNKKRPTTTTGIPEGPGPRPQGLKSPVSDLPGPENNPHAESRGLKPVGQPGLPHWRLLVLVLVELYSAAQIWIFFLPPAG